MKPGPRLDALSDPDLREAAAEALPIIDAYAAELDRVSGDIKALEKYLADSCVFVDASVPLNRMSSIGWQRFEGRRRVTYWSPGTLLLCPLIEMGPRVREEAKAALPTLLRAIAKAVSE